MPCSRSLVSYICARPICPTAAAACSAWISRGLPTQPRRFMPSAMAPLETITTSRAAPASPRTSTASWRDHSPMAASSRPRPSLVTRLEPTLTTMRRASRSRVEWASGVMESGVGGFGKTRIDGNGLVLGRLLGMDVLEHGLHQLLAALTRQRRDLEHRAFETQAAHEILDLGGALLGRHHVQLVEHQPARLAVQRGV